jgi:thiamine-monophosphate kinase
MARLTERQLVERLRQRFQSPSRAVTHGIGDDAAVLRAEDGAWVASVDASVQGVHFDLRFASLNDVGYRAFQAAASDLAAMGAAPVAALSALILPSWLDAAAIDEITRGQQAAALETGCPVVGGNISRGSELSVTTTVLGRCARPLLRSTARPGQELWLIGSLGLAAAGLASLRLAQRPGEAIERCRDAWRRPRALLAQGLELANVASSAIDISDGLAADAWQLGHASGVRIVVERERLRAALDGCLFAASRQLRRSALRFALYGGEDYALLATGPRSRRPSFAKPIGWVARGRGAVLLEGGLRTPLGRGYDHLIRA